MYGVDHYDVCAAITSGSALILQQLQHLLLHLVQLCIILHPPVFILKTVLHCSLA